MSQSLSAYLDLLRFFAALVVLLHHAAPILFPGVPLPFPGHHAVILFFFISGFVIAHVSSRPTLKLQDYTMDRLSRLLSVSVPALLLGLAVTLAVGASIAPLPVARHLGDFAVNTDQALLRTGLNLAFVGQLWSVNSMAPLNGVFWSLNYEFWYYLVFAAWHFSGPRSRIWLALTTLLIAGPRIALLLPCWIAGLLVYRNLDRWKISRSNANILFVLSTLGYLLVFWIDLPVRIRDFMDYYWPQWMLTLGGSRSFVGDYLLTILFSLNCIAFASMSNSITRVVSAIEPSAKTLGSYTFSLYAFHTPLLAVCVLALSMIPSFPGNGLIALSIVILGAIVFATVTEHKRQFLRSLLNGEWSANRMSDRFAQGNGSPSGRK